MTVPSLMQNHQRKTYVTQLHKVYNELLQASQQYITDLNAINLTEAGVNSQEALNNWIELYFKVVQKCDNSLTPCFALDEFRTLSGKSYSSGHAAATSYVLNNGVAIRPHYSNGDIYILADINAQKGPNIFGRDLFSMYVYPDGVIDDYMVNPECRINGNCNGGGTVRNYRENLFAECLSNAGSTLPKGCFGKILNDNWEMNY